MKKYLKWIICILSLSIFIILGYLVKTKSDIYLDNIIYSFISKFINNKCSHFLHTMERKLYMQKTLLLGEKKPVKY